MAYFSSKNARCLAWFAIAAVVSGCAGEFDDSSGAATSSEAEATSWKVLDVKYEAQQTGWWCGPASTRHALSARITPPTQQQLANQLGTTNRGTDYIGQITSVLNQYLGAGVYVTRELPSDPPSEGQKNRLWNDIVRGIDNNYPVVANIVAPPGNQPPGYPADQTIYHYFTIIGYNRDTRQVYVADSAFFGGLTHYWLSFEQLAHLIPPKGYSAWDPKTVCTGSPSTVGGAIESKYLALGGCQSPLGVPVSDELKTADGYGRFSVFQNGLIFWSPRTGAYAVLGAIRKAWEDSGSERGPLGYPTSDELETPDKKGRYNAFEKGGIYWTNETGAHAVYGLIYEKWASLNYENGKLGYPTSGEYDVQQGRRSDFQNGSITVDMTTKAVTVSFKNAK